MSVASTIPRPLLAQTIDRCSAQRESAGHARDDHLGCISSADRRQPVSEHRGEDVDHLMIAIVGDSKLAPHTLHRGRQHPILERCTIAQRAGLAGEHRHVMPS